MKPYINFLILVILAVVLYTAYGLLSFKADEPREFVFSEPKIPADIIRMDEANSAESKQNAQAIEESQKALSYYALVQTKAPTQANDTIAFLVDRMSNSDLPLYFLSHVDLQAGGLRKFETLKLNADNFIDSTLEKSKTTLSCSSKVPTAYMVLGTSDKDIMSCDVTRDIKGTGSDSDVVFIGGPGNDQITDTVGNRIINGGTGDDTIQLGAGRSIIILDASWGKDVVTVDCTGASIQPSEIPKDFPVPWIYKTTNFIVLGNSVNSTDLEWRGNILAHKITGDTLTVNENCFTVVPKIE